MGDLNVILVLKGVKIMSVEHHELPIKGFENYSITSDGHVFNNNLYNMNIRRELKRKINKHGYYYVALYKNGSCNNRLVHVLVAEHFIPNPNNLPQVNHKDLNKLNPDVSNLEWCTQSYNIKHSFANGSHDNSKFKKRVQQIHNNVVISEFNSVSEASNITKVNRAHISSCCNGKSKSAGGYEWRYTNV